jgi:hypothetical protein
VRLVAVELDQVLDEVGRVDRLGGDDERVGDVPADRVVLDPDRDVLDRHVGAAACPFDQVLSSEAEASLGQAREEDVGGRERAGGVVESQRRRGVEDRGHGVQPELVEDLLGHLDPAQGGVADLADVDDLPGDGLVLRRGEGDAAGSGVDELTEPAEQLAAAGDLVQERQDGAAFDVVGDHGRVLGGLGHLDPPPLPAAPTTAGSGPETSAPSSPPCMIAWRAPGTPNS